MIEKSWTTRAAISTLGGLLLAATVGCGGAYDSYVTGLVTLEGEPVSKGTVSFVPADGGPSAYAMIGSDGRYEVYTGKERGLPSGAYGVTVISREPPAVERSKTGGPPPPGKAITPPWYAMAQYSPLQFHVESGENEIDLKLTKEPPDGWQPRRNQR